MADIAVPLKMKIGALLGMFGGVIAIAAMAASWNNDVDSMYLVGLNMLTACMFFATAGTFTKYSPVSGGTALVISGIAVAAVIIAALYEATFLWASILMLVLAVACVLVAACPNVTNWVDSNRAF